MRRHARHMAAAIAAALVSLSMAAPAQAVTYTTYTNTDHATTKIVVKVAGNNIDPDDSSKRNTSATEDTVMAFSVPTEIPMVVMGDGTIVGPSSSATYIENLSVFAIHATSAKVTDTSPFESVADATKCGSADTNKVDYQVGTTAGPDGKVVTTGGRGFDASSSKGSAASLSDSSWNMAYHKDDSTYTDDEVHLVTSGNAWHIKADLTSAGQVGTILWTFAPGSN